MREYFSIRKFRKDPSKISQDQIDYMSQFQKLSDKFLWDFRDRINWINVCYNRSIKFTYEFLHKFRDYIDWSTITWKHGGEWNEQFIREHKDYIDYDNLARVGHLSEELIIELSDKLNVETVLQYHLNRYDETFLRSVLTLNPTMLQTAMKMNNFYFSPDFMREIKNNIHINDLTMSRNISKIWNMANEYKFELCNITWFKLITNDSPDLDLLLRFKENFMDVSENSRFVEWYIHYDKKDQNKFEELKEYIKWCREKALKEKYNG